MTDAAVTALVFVVVITIGRHARPRPPLCARVGPLADSPASPARRVRAHRPLVVGIACAAIATLIAGPMATAIVVVAVLLRPRLTVHRNRRRRVAAVNRAFPDFVDMLVLTIRSGCTPVQAIRTLRGSAPEALRAAVIAVDRHVADGQRFADAIRILAVELGPIAQPLSDSLALADRHGTPLAPILDRLADETRAHRRRAADVSARQLPIRLSFPLVGCTLPSFVLLTIVPLMAGTLSSLPGFSR